MKEELQEMAKDLMQIRNELKLNLSDEALFDSAIRIYISSKINSQRQPPRKPTERQIIFLKGHGFKGDINSLSFEEAKHIISSLLRK